MKTVIKLTILISIGLVTFLAFTNFKE